MLSPASNQAIELSSRDSYKYVKMDDYSDNDEVAFCQPNDSDTRQSQSSDKKSVKVKRILIISFTLIILIFLIFAVIGAVLIFEKPANYRGHKVYKLMPTSVEDLNNIIGFEKKFQVDFWNEPHFKYPSEPILIQVNPGQEEKLVNEELAKLELNYTVLIEDLQQAIEEERIAHQKTENETQFDFSRYHTYEEILHYLETEVINSSLAEVDFIGKSFEGRKLPLVRITSEKDNSSKPVILIDSLIHAKEWATGATNLFIINQLISNQLMQPYLEKFEFHVIPILNPDGYAYTWRSDRLWRKTRSFSIASFFCRGADANRNFDVNFCIDPEEEGKSSCSSNYCGDYPFSEPEIVAFRNHTLKLNQTNRLKAYFSLHTYLQRLLYPYAYKADLPDNHIELENLVNIAAKAIKSVHGSDYQAGTAYHVMYSASGTSLDWVYEKLNVKLSFAFELRDMGHFGHLLPKEMIIPTAQETWEGIKAILDNI